MDRPLSHQLLQQAAAVCEEKGHSETTKWRSKAKDKLVSALNVGKRERSWNEANTRDVSSWILEINVLTAQELQARIEAVLLTVPNEAEAPSQSILTPRTDEISAPPDESTLFASSVLVLPPIPTEEQYGIVENASWSKRTLLPFGKLRAAISPSKSKYRQLNSELCSVICQRPNVASDDMLPLKRLIVSDAETILSLRPVSKPHRRRQRTKTDPKYAPDALLKKSMLLYDRDIKVTADAARQSREEELALRSKLHASMQRQRESTVVPFRLNRLAKLHCQYQLRSALFKWSQLVRAAKEEEGTLGHHVLQVQRIARGHLARKRVTDMRLRRLEKACKTIQRHTRVYIERKQLERERESCVRISRPRAVAIQSGMRGFLSRRRSMKRALRRLKAGLLTLANGNPVLFTKRGASGQAFLSSEEKERVTMAVDACRTGFTKLGSPVYFWWKTTGISRSCRDLAAALKPKGAESPTQGGDVPAQSPLFSGPSVSRRRMSVARLPAPGLGNAPFSPEIAAALKKKKKKKKKTKKQRAPEAGMSSADLTAPPSIPALEPVFVWPSVVAQRLALWVEDLKLCRDNRKELCREDRSSRRMVEVGSAAAGLNVFSQKWRAERAERQLRTLRLRRAESARNLQAVTLKRGEQELQQREIALSLARKKEEALQDLQKAEELTRRQEREILLIEEARIRRRELPKMAVEDGLSLEIERALRYKKRIAAKREREALEAAERKALEIQRWKGKN